MKIKLSILLLFFLVIIFSSCTETVTKTVTITDTVVETVVNNSVLNRLTQKQWTVDSVYSNYTGLNTGTLIYAKGGTSNAVDYSTNRLDYARILSLYTNYLKLYDSTNTSLVYYVYKL